MAELIARRRFLGFVAVAPAIVRASSLMGIRVIRPLIEREIIVVYPDWTKIDPVIVEPEIFKILWR